ncbi:D-alanine--D-alanine ligase [Endozoicomonas ascidiicola]|uniref:D-alanine--D-alanine ligase n=1 Tax=Endozoicomonas ascidiicola TaxID=1698521 RepID=UPI00082A4DF2|nr:D-alanine--D-alanine ligase [Endozoicomonas ascidiicola]
MKYDRSDDPFDPASFGKVAVLYGGHSAEREVSLNSGQRIFDSLKSQGVECLLIDTAEHDSAERYVEQLLNYKPDMAFIALHGRGGEDGTMQGFLESMGIPYTGSGVMASALAMDKYRCKLLWQSIGLPTAEFALITDFDNIDSLEYAETLLPAFVKPSLEGSSVGVTRVDRRQDLEAACRRAGEHKGPVLVESFIDGPEFTVGILNGQVLPAIRVEATSEFYDYEAKYLSDSTRYHLPSGLTEVKEQELQAIALTAFESIGCEGWGRVDFMQDQQGRFWLLEVNTIPGMTDHSLVPMAANAAGLSFDDLIVEILNTASGR